MTELRRNCPCCNNSASAMASQCDGCGYDYQTKFTLPQTATKPTQINSAQLAPLAPKQFAPLTFAAPTVILPPLVGVEEEAFASEPPPSRSGQNKHNLPILVGSLGAAAVILLFVMGSIVLHARQRTPGPQAQALAGLMKPYELTSEKQFTAVFGRPTTRDAKTVQGMPYDFWGYKCSDGAALVTFNIRSNQIERVTAVGPGS